MLESFSFLFPLNWIKKNEVDLVPPWLLPPSLDLRCLERMSSMHYSTVLNHFIKRTGNYSAALQRKVWDATCEHNNTGNHNILNYNTAIQLTTTHWKPQHSEPTTQESTTQESTTQGTTTQWTTTQWTTLNTVNHNTLNHNTVNHT